MKEKLKKCAIICEYNPLHNGHIHQLNNAKEQTGADIAIAIMSGNFSQRGLPCCLSKENRAEHAIKAGFDLVVELPTPFALQSAEDFAFGGVGIAKQLQCQFLHFGSECGDIESLKKCAEILSKPTKQFSSLTKEYLQKGVSYPKAVSQSLLQIFDIDILEKPNNSLAAEYIKQIAISGANITPMTIRREDNFNSTSLSGSFCSATAIRNAMCQENLQDIDKFLPEYVLQDLVENYFDGKSFEEFAHRFLSMQNAKQLEDVYGMTEGLHNKMESCSKEQDYETFLQCVKSKRYTLLKVQRLIANSVLGITNDIMKQMKSTDFLPNVLAIKKHKSKEILSHFDDIGVKLNLGSTTCPVTQKADRLFHSLTNTKMPNLSKLKKID